VKRVTIAGLADTKPYKRAEKLGLDLTLLEQNFALTPIERLRKLQDAVNSIHRLRKRLPAHR
jgi:hypothetical protein